MGPWGPKGPMPPGGHFWALWGPKGPTRGTGGLRGSPRSPPEAPGAFLEKPGFWPPGGLPARGKISHRKVSSKGSQPRRDPSRDLRLDKLVPQKIPSPELSTKEKSKSRIFFRNPAVWSSAGGGNSGLAAAAGLAAAPSPCCLASGCLRRFFSQQKMRFSGKE